MKIHYNIANGHKRGPNGMKDYIESNPSKAPDDAAGEWIANKFGSWINSNISADFTIEFADTDKFVVDFTYEDDADEFVRKLGGYALEA